MGIATVTSKGQMTLPKDVRDDLHIKPGDQVIIEKRNGEYVLRPRRSALALLAELPRYKGRPLSVEEMDEAIAEEVAERNKPR
jgi:AbrB family looped-hinge helix DNA binding protein